MILAGYREGLTATEGKRRFLLLREAMVGCNKDWMARRDPPCPVCGEPVLGAVNTRTTEKRDAGGRIRRKTVFLHSVCGTVEKLRGLPARKREAELRQYVKVGCFHSKAHEEKFRALVAKGDAAPGWPAPKRSTVGQRARATEERERRTAERARDRAAHREETRRRRDQASEAPAARGRTSLHPTLPRSRRVWVGEARYLVRWIKGKPYLYRREYLGAAGHSRPRFQDTYLGRLDEDVARGEEDALVAAAKAAARRHGGV